MFPPPPAPPCLSQELLARVSHYIGRRIGLHYPPRRFRDLERGLRAACQAFGHADLQTCARWLVDADLTPDEIRRLASHLTTGETYFFREPKTLDEMRQQALTDLIFRRQRSGNRMLRVWSAGCCTGEEAYTLAIMLFRLLPAIHTWHVEILGTDINEGYLDRARAGVYREWSFRNAPKWLKRDFFRNIGEGEYEIVPAVRSMVRFGTLNLATDAYPSMLTNTTAMDIILCRNVLIYFDLALTEAVLRRFKACLAPDGWLVTGPAEAAVIMDTGIFTPVHGGDALLFRNCCPRQEADCADPDEPDYLGEERDCFAAAAPPPENGTDAAEIPCAGADSDAGAERDATDAAQPSRSRTAGLSGTYVRDEGRRDAAQDASASHSVLDAARLAFAAGDCHAALQLVMAEVDASPAAAAPALYALAAHCLANLGHVHEAHLWCGKALERDALDPLLHYLMATIMQEEGDMAGAKACLGKAIYLDQHFIMAHFTLAGITRQLGDTAWSRHLHNGLALVRRMADDAVVPHTGGMTAGRLAGVMQAMRGGGAGSAAKDKA